MGMCTWVTVFAPSNTEELRGAGVLYVVAVGASKQIKLSKPSVCSAGELQRLLSCRLPFISS